MVKFTPGEKLDPMEFPVIEGMSPVDGDSLAPFILARDSCEQIRKAIPKKTHMPILGTVALDVTQTNANGCAVMAVTDLENPQVFRPKKIDGNFPDWKAIVPEAGKGVKIGFTLEVLEKMLSTLKALDVRCFSMEITDGLSPVRVEAKTRDQDNVLAVIMPCKI